MPRPQLRNLAFWLILTVVTAIAGEHAGAEPPDGSAGGPNCAGVFSRTRALLKSRLPKRETQVIAPPEVVAPPANLWSPLSESNHGLPPPAHPLPPQEVVPPPANLYAPLEHHAGGNHHPNPPTTLDPEAMRRTDEFLQRMELRLNPHIALDPTLAPIAAPTLWGRADALQSPAAPDAHAWSLLNRFQLKIGKPEVSESPQLWTEKQYKEHSGQHPDLHLSPSPQKPLRFELSEQIAPLPKPTKVPLLWTEKQYRELSGQHPDLHLSPSPQKPLRFEFSEQPPQAAPIPVPEPPANWNILPSSTPQLKK